MTADIEGSEDHIILTGAKDGITKFNIKTGEHEYITKLWTDSEGLEKVRRSVTWSHRTFFERWPINETQNEIQ